MSKRLGIFGGTFDPIHTGHLAVALQVQDALALDQLRLMPSHLPPHRTTPSASSEQRAAMVELAIAGYPKLSVDQRELARNRASYTIDSLREIRREEGESALLFFVMGMDSLNALDTWHEWQQLTDYAHLVVLARPGQNWPSADSVVGTWLASRLGSVTGLGLQACGTVLRLESDLAQSATAIRAAIRSKQPDQPWLLPTVARYIEDHQLYRRES